MTGSNRPSKAQICHHIKAFLFTAQYRLLLFALIYPGNICRAHMLSFINTQLQTYKVTHIHTWLLPSATTVFYCPSNGQLHQSNLDVQKFAWGHYDGCSWIPWSTFILANQITKMKIRIWELDPLCNERLLKENVKWRDFGNLQQISIFRYQSLQTYFQQIKLHSWLPHYQFTCNACHFSVFCCCYYLFLIYLYGWLEKKLQADQASWISVQSLIAISYFCKT